MKVFNGHVTEQDLKYLHEKKKLGEAINDTILTIKRSCNNEEYSR